ncbi:Phage Tail Protein X [Morganella morganii]|nr:Phage Tail Protein X [Morganella morganii]
MRDDTLGTTFTRYYRHTEGVIDTMLQANLGLSKLVSFGAMFLGKLARIADLGG